MNSGPGPLDLLTPLSQGVQAGQQAAYRRDQLSAEAAREADMKARLGLEANAQQFQQNMWASQADMRSAQLSLVQSQAQEQAQTLNNVANDHPVLADGMANLDKFAANNDYQGLLNAPPPAFTTPQAAQAYEQHRNQLLQTSAGAAAAGVVNANLAVTAARANTQAEQIKQLGGIPNANPDDFYDNVNGQKVWNAGKAAAAINAFGVQAATNAEQVKADIQSKAAIAEQKAKTEGYLQVINAKGTKEEAQNKVQAGLLRTQLNSAQKDLADARKIGDVKAIAKAQATYDGLQQQLNAVSQGGSGAPSAAPQPNAIQNPLDWLNGLNSGQ